jgi:AraC-like DNA-binding protein
VAPHAKERVLPTGTMELVITLREDTLRVYDQQDHTTFQSFRGSVLCGAHSEFFVIDTASQAAIMGVHFKPGGAFPFLQRPAWELHNTHVSVDTFWGTKATALRERLLGAKTPETRFCILEQLLFAQASRSLARHPAVAAALTELQCVPHPQPLADLTERIGLCHRRFIQVFREAVGLTPKRFCRIPRFQDVVRRIGRRQRIEWVDVALACGYVDQAHFIHDFRAFSGLNPTTYCTQRGAHLNHVPLPE